MTALTVSEALARVESHKIDHIFPGSWINANFDVWIGAEEDNRAWEYVLRARQAYDAFMNSPDAALIPEDRKLLAYEELMIAEGSDWCWWYGPEHDSANRPEFDQLFRDHLANVYLALRLPPPEELSRPILKASVKEFHQPPSGPIRPTIDGQITSYFEWMGAGIYRVDGRSGAMHGQRFFVQEMHYGSDGQNLFVRLDFVENSISTLEGTELRINVLTSGEPRSFTLRLTDRRDGIESAHGRICEMRLPLASMGVPAGQPVKFQLSLWQGGLPMDALPSQNWIELSTAEPTDWVL